MAARTRRIHRPPAPVRLLAAAPSLPKTANGQPAAAPDDEEAASELASDACALLTVTEVQQLAPMASEGTPTTDEGAIANVGWVWDWSDPSGAIDGTGSLEVHVSSLPPGVSEQTIRQSLTVEVADAGENGRELSGIGEYAILTSVIGGSAEVQALVDGRARHGRANRLRRWHSRPREAGRHHPACGACRRTRLVPLGSMIA